MGQMMKSPARDRIEWLALFVIGMALTIGWAVWGAWLPCACCAVAALLALEHFWRS